LYIYEKHHWRSKRKLRWLGAEFPENALPKGKFLRRFYTKKTQKPRDCKASAPDVQKNITQFVSKLSDDVANPVYFDTRDGCTQLGNQGAFCTQYR